MLRILGVCALACAIVSTTAEARPRSTGFDPSCNISMPCIGAPMPFERATAPVSPRAARYAKAEFGSPIVPPETGRTFLKRQPQTLNTFGNLHASSQGIERAAAQILPHPNGCRRNLFCGCGASVYLFGKAVNAGGLATASNWLGFPRASPGPGMAEVTRGGRHVRVITASLGNGLYQFYDANSGGRLTRSHAGPIKGIVVDPRGGNRYASAE